MLIDEVDLWMHQVSRFDQYQEGKLIPKFYGAVHIEKVLGADNFLDRSTQTRPAEKLFDTLMDATRSRFCAVYYVDPRYLPISYPQNSPPLTIPAACIISV